MSDKDRPSRVAGDDGDEQQGEREGPTETIKCKGCGREGKRLSLFRFRKGSKKPLNERKQRKGNLGNSYGSGGWCCLCVKQPRTLDSSGESTTSDPNSSEFSFDMLRALIEKNDFYSKECNPHLDVK